MTPREHSRLARELIAACGGLEEACAACRTSKSVLSTYQNPNEAATMPARVIAELETYAGQPLYSRALFERFDAPKAPAADLSAQACALTEAAAVLQHTTRTALADGVLTPREADALAKAESDVEAALHSARAARQATEAGSRMPPLKVV